MTIKRGEEAANPILRDMIKRDDVTEFDYYEVGITIREQMAILAMQGYLAGKMAYSGEGAMSPSVEEVAEESVSYADALLAELERTQ